MPSPAFPAPTSKAPGPAQGTAGQLREPVAHSARNAAIAAGRPRRSFGEEQFKAGRGARQAVHRRWRHHAGGALAAHEQALAASPLALYRALRTLNPSPYMFYFNFEDFHVVGASPEILVRLELEDGERVTVRPIAGTRKRRGVSFEEDRGAGRRVAGRREGARRAPACCSTSAATTPAASRKTSARSRLTENR
jgi:anthranilate synthase component 1